MNATQAQEMNLIARQAYCFEDLEVGMELPGPGAIYVSQTLNFRAPVKIGDRVIAKVRVMELYPPKQRARFECVCSVDGKPVLEGEAVLMVPSRPAAVQAVA